MWVLMGTLDILPMLIGTLAGETFAVSLMGWRMLGGTRAVSLTLGGLLLVSGMLTGTMQDSTWLKRGGCTIGSLLDDQGTFCPISKGTEGPQALTAGGST